jgi:hypothetical protein
MERGELHEGAAARGYRDAGRWALFVQVMLALRILTDGALVLFEVLNFAVGGVAESMDGASSLLVGIVALAVLLTYLPALLVSGIAWLVWTYRAMKNAHALAEIPPGTSPTGAVVAWFIPFVNLFLPLTVMREIETASDPGEEGFVPSSLSTAWWVAFLGSNFVAVCGLSLAGEHPTAGALGVIALGWVVRATAAVLGIQLVRRIQSNQDTKSRRMRWEDVF